MIKLAMYKGKGNLFNGLIRYWTNSPYSHCEIVIDGMMYSSSIRDGGVRCKRFDASDNWDIVDLPWADAKTVMNHYFVTFKTDYGWLDLITRQVLKIPSIDNEGEFCSEWCAAALGLPNARDYSPQSLYDLAIYVNRLNHNAH